MIFDTDTDLSSFDGTAVVYDGATIITNLNVDIGTTSITVSLDDTSDLPLGCFNYELNVTSGLREQGTFVVVGLGQMPDTEDLELTAVPPLPNQPGHAGDFLVTDGSAASWVSPTDYFGTFTVSVDDITVIEHNNQFGGGWTTAIRRETHDTVTFRVSCDRIATSVPASIHYTVNNGSYLGNYGFTAQSGTLTWDAGDTADKTVTVVLAAKTDIATDCTFQFTLSSPSTFTAMPAQLEGGIIQNIIMQERIIVVENAPIFTYFDSDTSDPQTLASTPFEVNSVGAVWVPKRGTWNIAPLGDEGPSHPVLTGAQTGLNFAITTTNTTLNDPRVQSLIYIPPNADDYRVGVIARANVTGTEGIFCCLCQENGTQFMETFTIASGVLTHLDGGGFGTTSNGWVDFGFDPAVGGYLQLAIRCNGPSIDGTVQGFDCAGNGTSLYAGNTFVGFGMWCDDEHPGSNSIIFNTFVATGVNAVP